MARAGHLDRHTPQPVQASALNWGAVAPPTRGGKRIAPSSQTSPQLRQMTPA